MEGRVCTEILPQRCELGERREERVVKVKGLVAFPFPSC